MSPDPLIHLSDPALARAVEQGMAATELALRKAVSGPDRFAEAASRHLLDAGGKRLRPLLVVLAAQVGQGVDQAVIDAATVVELTHLASLYHDDVIDRAPRRRGVDAAHEVFGPTVAILTGDLLFAKASQVVAGLGPWAVRLQAETFERLCLGQIHETVGPPPGGDPVAHHMSVLADKTGSLIATSARFGAQLAGCSPPVVEALAAYGEAVGVAFQLADDLIDLVSPSVVTGKTPGTDLRERVPTMPQLLVERAAQEDLAAGLAESPNIALAQAFNQDLSDDATLAQVVERLLANPAVDQARAVAANYAQRSVDQLAILPPGPVKDALSAVAELFAKRLA